MPIAAESPTLLGRSSLEGGVPDSLAYPGRSVLAEAEAWALLQALALRAGNGKGVADDCGIMVGDDGDLDQVELGSGCLDLHPAESPLYAATGRVEPAARRLLDLYLPLCIGEGCERRVVGHVGQSLDGQIATASGASCFITGQEDLIHTHRLRALFDAVVVGRTTVACDDPRLTTRLVPGRNPTRVVIDPALRSPVERKLFGDGATQTLILCARMPIRSPMPSHGQAEIVEIAADGQLLPPAAILEELGRRGLRRVFIEGGGITVSHFLQAGLLDRLHVTISPLLVGQGRPGLALPKIDGLDQAVRPQVRTFHLGEDVLFDCAL